MEWTRESGSFQDPSGFIFTSDGVLYRQVNAAFEDAYRALIDSGLYAELAGAGLLVPHDEVELRLPNGPPAYAVLRPARIPFVSYPYEWCFSQFKAAALLTLELQKRALARGLVLRDASAYNIQFANGRPIFIDTLSFGRYIEGRPWLAYRQFCHHFLNPLALMALVNPALGQLSRVNIDGIPLGLTADLLPFASRFRVGLLMHIHLHRRSGVSGAEYHTRTRLPARARRMTKIAMLGLADSLVRTVQQLSWSPPPTLWSTYTEHSHYSPAAQECKQRVVANWLHMLAKQEQTDTIWDLGGNIGTYSGIAAAHARLVVSLDLDHAAVEYHHLTCHSRGQRNVLPLVQDLRNPSPAIGWNNIERQSLKQRGPADIALALALLHHLVIGGNVPIEAVARFFSEICRHLIIEFVPKEDSQIQRMLMLREDIFADYSASRFEESFRRHFEIVASSDIEGTSRTLYLLKRR